MSDMVMDKGVKYRGRMVTIGRLTALAQMNDITDTSACGEGKGSFSNYCHRDRQAIFSFHTALRNGDASKVMYFMETFPDLKLLQIPTRSGRTCLQVAIQNQSYKLFIYLLENGASPNQPNTTSGDTALHTSCRARDIKVTAMLSKYGAHSNVFNFKNETPFTIAAESGDLDLIELLAPNTQRAIRGTFNRSESTMSLSGLVDDAEGAPATPRFGGPTPSMSNLLLGTVKRDNALQAIQGMDSIVKMKSELPVLEGWLERLDDRGWTMVWVVIKGSYLLWSREERNICDTQNIAERRQFDKYVNMMNILEAKPIENEHSNMAFSFVVDQGARKRYVWRSMYEEDRHFWLDGLRKYRQCLKAQISYLRD